MNQLDGLKQFSIIAADTGDVNMIRHYNIQNATTNPSLILKSPLLTNYYNLFEDALNYARKKGGDKNKKIINAGDKLIVNIGTKILENITGNVSTEIDATLSFDTNLTVQKAQKIISMYQENNIDKNRVLIKIAATWEGIKAAEILEKAEIKCNLTLVFSFAQAKACAESGVYLISPFVGRIYDWYDQHNLLNPYSVENDPGIKSLKKIFFYYKNHHYDTIIMGASFRTIEQILSVSGCDYLTISPNFLNKLFNNEQCVKCCLCLPKPQIFDSPKPLSKRDFFLEHNQDKMAVQKLNEGIHQFITDHQRLNKIIIQKL